VQQRLQVQTNGGLNAQVYRWSGLANAVAHASADSLSTANPAVAGSFANSGDLLFAVAYARKNSAVVPSAGWTLLDTDRVAGSAEDTFVTEYKIESGAATPASFSNPIQYNTKIVAVELTHA